jgi:hypothetical protein
MGENLMSATIAEMNRVRKLITEYERLPDNAGFFGASIMKVTIKNAEKAISDGDVVELLVAYKQLQEHTG